MVKSLKRTQLDLEEGGVRGELATPPMKNVNKMNARDTTDDVSRQSGDK